MVQVRLARTNSCSGWPWAQIIYGSSTAEEKVSIPRVPVAHFLSVKEDTPGIVLKQMRNQS